MKNKEGLIATDKDGIIKNLIEYYTSVYSSISEILTVLKEMKNG